jgi:uncharacterized protein YecE (DUF72 family)
MFTVNGKGIRTMNHTIKIGCCGFPVARTKYFEDFNVVELQQTFYQPPENSLAEKWRKASPANFEFTLKAWQLITHEPSSPTYRKLKTPIPSGNKKRYGSFKPTDEVLAAWEKTEEIAEILHARVIVFQCPASFRPTTEHKRDLKAFFSSIQRNNFIFAWEPRGDWEEAEIRDLCAELNLVHVVDPFKAASAYGTVRYHRLHGIGGYRYKYTKADLEKFKESIAADTGRLEMYVLFNNVYMHEDALAFKKLLETQVSDRPAAR